MSIRLRLVVTYSALLFIILAVISISVITITHWAFFEAVDRTLEQAVGEVIHNFGPPTIQMNNRGQQAVVFSLPEGLDVFSAANVMVQVWDDSMRLVTNSDNLGAHVEPLDADAISVQEPTRRNVIVNNYPLRVLTRPVRVGDDVIGHIQAAQEISYILEAQSQVALIMFTVSAIALIVSVFVGNKLIERALRPIEMIAQAASQIATGNDLSRRIPYDGPPDELGRLTMIFNATLGRLEHLFTVQQRFVADVSHELRTPLTVIRGNSEIIRRYGLDEEALDAIDSESQRMARLVGDLLLLAQADAGELPLVTDNMELDTLVLGVFEQGQVLTGKDGPRVILGRFEVVRVHADQDRLKQLLLNLLNNAIKHTPADGTITLSVWPDGPEAMLSVADTGEGIPAEDLTHIFDRFYRVDKARARRHGGAGLGLSIAHWIADAHGGRIRVESTVGKGTTFIVHLPRQIPPPETTAETVVGMRAALSER